MKKTRMLSLTVLSLAFGGTALANNVGFITPTTTTLTITQVAAIKDDNSQLILSTSTMTATFNRTDRDFAQVNLGDITVPSGRYIGFMVGYKGQRTIVVNGNKYTGTSGSQFSNGDTVYSVGSDGLASGSLSKTAPASATTLSFFVNAEHSDTISSTSYFATPVCLSSDKSICQATDIVVDPSTAKPKFNLLLDLYNSVAVDADSGAIVNLVPAYPYPVVGDPGAAMHLEASGGTDGNITLLFDGSKKLIYASTAANASSLPGLCNTQSVVAAVNASAAPSGAPAPVSGAATFVQSFNSSTGVAQFVAGQCNLGASSCTSAGMITTTDLRKSVGQTVTVSCVADSAATPPYLGYTYTGGAGTGSSTTFTVARIIDPSNLFGGICTTDGGSCGTYP